MDTVAQDECARLVSWSCWQLALFSLLGSVRDEPVAQFGMNRIASDLQCDNPICFRSNALGVHVVVVVTIIVGNVCLQERSWMLLSKL